MSRSVWVGCLRPDVDQEDVQFTFERYGIVRDLWVRKAPSGPDCFAVVTFDHPSAAAAAMEGLQGRALPALTFRSLKLREWAEKVQQHRQHQYHQQYNQAPPHQQQRQRDFGSSWRSSGQASWGQQDEQAAPQPAQRSSWAQYYEEKAYEHEHEHEQQYEVEEGESGAWWAATDEPAGPQEQHLHQQHRVQQHWHEEDEEGGEEGEEEAGDEEEEEDDPIVELWVGNLCGQATRVAIRRAFECFGEVASLKLQRAPGSSGLQFAFVQLPASAAEVAIEELNGLAVRELTGEDLPLSVRQSARSLKSMQHWQQRQQGHGAAGGNGGGRGSGAGRGISSRPAAAAEAAAELEGLQAVCEDGSVQPLQGTLRQMKRLPLVVCEGPPSASLWVGNVGGQATDDDMRAVFGRYGSVRRVRLNRAPGANNNYQFAIVELASSAQGQQAYSALQGTMEQQVCSGLRLKLRYAWPRNLLRPAGRRQPAAARAAAVRAEQAQAQEQAQEQVQAAIPDLPAVASPLSCAACGSGAGTADSALKRCSGCHCTWYCSRECQVQHWGQGHDRDCLALQQLGALLQVGASANHTQPQQGGQQEGAIGTQQQQQPQPQITPELAKLLLAALQQQATAAPGRQALLVQAALKQAKEAAAAGDSSFLT